MELRRTDPIETAGKYSISEPDYRQKSVKWPTAKPATDPSSEPEPTISLRAGPALAI